MWKKRLFENVVEFLLLCLLLYIYFLQICNLMSKEYSESGGSDTAMGFALAMFFFYAKVYAVTFLVNLVLQSIFLSNLSKIKMRYYWIKIALFSVTGLFVPTLIGIYFEPVRVINFALFIDVLLSRLIILFIFFFIPYILIIASFYFIDKKIEKKRDLLHHVENVES